MSGPAADVAAFQKAAVRTESGLTTSLSFAERQRHLPRSDQEGLAEPVDPWDDTDGQTVGTPESERRAQPGMMNPVYRFSLDRYEPDTLLIRASRLFPQLCFVLGWVAANVDQQASRFIHDGDTCEFPLPASEGESFYQESYRRHGLSLDPDVENDNDEAFWAETEADWAMIDAVVMHWNGMVVDSTLNSSLQSESPNPQFGRPCLEDVEGN